MGIQKILILVGLFILALIAGYFFAQAIGIDANHPTDPPSTQVRYLVIRVDDFNKNNPALLTVWGIIASFSNPTSIYFTPIYPVQQNLADLTALFSLNKDRTLSEGFIKGLEKYNLDLSGYIVVDTQGSDGYLNWLIPTKNRVLSTAPASTKQIQSLLNQQRQYYTQVCQLLTKSGKLNPQALNWKGIYPDHLIPSPNIESIMILLDRLFSDPQPIDCNVLE